MRYPLIRILFPFCLGIWLSIHFSFDLPFWILLLFLAVSLLLYRVQKLNSAFQLRSKWIIGTWIYFITAITGFWICNEAQTIPGSGDFSKAISSSKGFLVELKDNPAGKNTISHSSAKILFANDGKKWSRVSADVMLFFKDANIRYGNILFIKNSLEPVQPRTFPFDFNYKKYLQRQNIFYSAFLNPAQFISLGNKGNPLYTFSYSERNRLLQFLQSSFTDPDITAIAGSLIAGYQNDMDADLRAQFVNTGTVHILAVSGLRIGILLSVIGLFLFPVRRRYPKTARVMAICFIWLYVIATGCTGAGIRVAVFLTLLTGAKFLRRTPQPLNLLACAAFLILIFNPLILSDVGFQLSLSAVAGIILFQQPLASLVSPPNSVVKYILDLIAITCAAQIFLLPLQLYYFHLFPMYSILSNVIVVPIVFLVTYSAIGMLLFSWLPAVSAIFIYLVRFFIQCINYVVATFNHFPFSAVSFTQLNRGEVLLLFLVVFSFSFFLFTKNKEFAFFFLASLLIFISLEIRDDFQTSKRSHAEFYTFDKYPMLEITEGKGTIIFGDTSRIHSDKMHDWIAYEKNQFTTSFAFIPWQKIQSGSLDKIPGFPFMAGRNNIIFANHYFHFSFARNNEEPSSGQAVWASKKGLKNIRSIYFRQVRFSKSRNPRDTLFMHRNDYINLQNE